jgi:hypothetical protein
MEYKLMAKYVETILESEQRASSSTRSLDAIPLIQVPVSDDSKSGESES